MFTYFYIYCETLVRRKRGVARYDYRLQYLDLFSLDSSLVLNKIPLQLEHYAMRHIAWEYFFHSTQSITLYFLCRAANGRIPLAELLCAEGFVDCGCDSVQVELYGGRS